MNDREKELERRIAELESECRELREKVRLLDGDGNRAGSYENKDENTARSSAGQAASKYARLFDQPATVRTLLKSR